MESPDFILARTIPVVKMAGMLQPLLLVVDMQNDFLDTWPAAKRECLLRSTSDLVSSMRAHGCPVVWVRQEFEPDLRDAFLAMKSNHTSITIKGTRGCEIAEQLPIAPSDPVIVKKRFSAFFGTSLEEILAKLRPDTLIMRYLQREIARGMTNREIEAALE